MPSVIFSAVTCPRSTAMEYESYTPAVRLAL